MIKKLTLENWKSFRKADLYIDPITVLIGKNASGKSNIIDAFDFLSRIARKETVETALNGNGNTLEIRGGSEWATRKSEYEFSLKVVIDGDQYSDYLYSVTIDTNKGLSLKHESINLITEKNREHLEPIEINSLLPDASYYEIRQEHLEAYERLWTEQPSYPLYVEKKVLCSGFDSLQNAQVAHVKTFDLLRKIFVFNPIPSKMRNYSKLSPNLERDASNIAGVIAALPEHQKLSLENELCCYLAQIPEFKIEKVWVEIVGSRGEDAILYCEETLNEKASPLQIYPRVMSDGILKFLALLTAMLTLPAHSLVVIEEVENGLHPSRAGLLLEMLRDIGKKRQIDVLLTTHNPALLDELIPDFLPFVMIVYRNMETGESQIIPLEDMDNLAKLISSGSLGEIVRESLLENSLQRL
ncbi:AAA family ATPase [Spirulina sp. 06S082]|uniref:AAA family ATPase n=1 Tax=Spirulina sp. 06S082 TaxID=3110248 RepID=UPI003A4D4570